MLKVFNINIINLFIIRLYISYKSNLLQIQLKEYVYYHIFLKLYNNEDK